MLFKIYILGWFSLKNILLTVTYVTWEWSKSCLKAKLCSIVLCILVVFWYIFSAFTTNSVLAIRRTSLFWCSPLRCSIYIYIYKTLHLVLICNGDTQCTSCASCAQAHELPLSHWKAHCFHNYIHVLCPSYLCEI